MTELKALDKAGFHQLSGNCFHEFGKLIVAVGFRTCQQFLPKIMEKFLGCLLQLVTS
jgi:hypothetical protein